MTTTGARHSDPGEPHTRGGLLRQFRSRTHTHTRYSPRHSDPPPTQQVPSPIPGGAGHVAVYVLALASPWCSLHCKCGGSTMISRGIQVVWQVERNQIVFCSSYSDKRCERGRSLENARFCTWFVTHATRDQSRRRQRVPERVSRLHSIAYCHAER